jgi:enamine deaminase RidA (YjgF/YER057c/UK114 family)
MLKAAALALPVLAVLTLAQGAQAADVQRTYAKPDALFASNITVPAGSDLVFLSGAAMPPAAAGASNGGTEAQADAVLKGIVDNLKSVGLGPGDVVSMHVYLVGDPAKGGAMDFAGWNAAYRRVFGSADQPNRPTRTTVQVSALAVPGDLVEVEVVAARGKH